VEAVSEQDSAENDALLAKVRNAISDEWMRAEHDPSCSGSPNACSRTCPVPFYQGAGFDQLLDAAALAATRVLPPATEVRR
jgi:hypothetical protein